MRIFIPPFALPVILMLFLLIACNSAHQTTESTGKDQLTPSKPEFKTEVLGLIRGGDTGKALEVLEKTNSTLAMQLKAGFDQSSEDFSLGLITFEDFFLVHARTNYALLESMVKEEAVPTLVPGIKQKVLTLVTEGQLKDALGLLLPTMEEDATLQLGRLQTAEKYLGKGLITNKEMDMVEKRVQFAILELAQ